MWPNRHQPQAIVANANEKDGALANSRNKRQWVRCPASAVLFYYSTDRQPGAYEPRGMIKRSRRNDLGVALKHLSDDKESAVATREPN